VDQARAKARAEAEAAAEQRCAGALALDCAEFNKQARSLLCMCGGEACPQHCHSLLCSAALCVQLECKWSRCTCHARGTEDRSELQCLEAPEAPVLLMTPFPLRTSAQVYQACTKARAEAEAAAKQRVAEALALERAELDKQVQLTHFVRQCCAALAWFCRV